MKRVAIAVLCTISFLVFSAASGVAQIPVTIGLRAGVNFADVSVSGLEPGVSLSTSTRTGLIVGGTVELGLSGPFFVEGGIVYAQKGAEFDLSQFGVSGTGKLKGDYLEIPVTLKAKFGVADVKPYVYAGPNIGFNLSAESEITVGGVTVTEDIKDNTKSIDFALDIGGGLEFKVAPRTSLFGDVRYSLGLTNNNDDPNDPTEIKTRDIKVGLGVSFHLK